MDWRIVSFVLLHTSLIAPGKKVSVCRATGFQAAATENTRLLILSGRIRKGIITDESETSVILEVSSCVKGTPVEKRASPCGCRRPLVAVSFIGDDAFDAPVAIRILVVSACRIAIPE
jgi:hypothetical protein